VHILTAIPVRSRGGKNSTQHQTLIFSAYQVQIYDDVALYHDNSKHA
jgi:hypothetical protein